MLKEVSVSIVITVELLGLEGSPFTLGENKCCSKDKTELAGVFRLNLFQNSPDLMCEDILDVEDEIDLIEA